MHPILKSSPVSGLQTDGDQGVGFEARVIKMGGMDMEGEDETGIYEIRVKKVAELSSEAQREVRVKLAKTPEGFKFQGYAKITYTYNSPLRVVSVDPIEGTVISLFNAIRNSLPQP